MGLLSKINPGFSMLNSFLHPEKGYQKGQEQLDKYYGQSQANLQPYMNQGQEAYGSLSGAMQSLLNPNDLYNQWMQGYDTSPAAMDAIERAKQHGMNAASSMGILGSTPALQAIQSGASEIGNMDRENHFGRLMNLYLNGAGLAQGIYGQGANAAGQLSNNAMNMGNNSAQMAYGQQAAPGALFGNMVGTAASIYGGNKMAGSGGAQGQTPPIWNTSGGR